jgi:hypothetical protein
MSNSFKNPLVPLLENPVNLERPIQALQVALAELSWLEKSFGRAWTAVKSSEGFLGMKRVLAYPQVWQGPGKDLLEVLPNDNVKSQSFFKVEDPIETLEYVMDGFSIMKAPVSLVVWFNLQRIDSTVTYNFTEQLKADVQRKITTALLAETGSVEILKIWEGAANVFKGYDISLLKDQELVYPFGGFRFELAITYQEDCPQ